MIQMSVNGLNFALDALLLNITIYDYTCR